MERITAEVRVRERRLEEGVVCKVIVGIITMTIIIKGEKVE